MRKNETVSNNMKVAIVTSMLPSSNQDYIYTSVDGEIAHDAFIANICVVVGNKVVVMAKPTPMDIGHAASDDAGENTARRTVSASTRCYTSLQVSKQCTQQCSKIMWPRRSVVGSSLSCCHFGCCAGHSTAGVGKAELSQRFDTFFASGTSCIRMRDAIPSRSHPVGAATRKDGVSECALEKFQEPSVLHRRFSGSRNGRHFSGIAGQTTPGATQRVASRGC